MTNQWPRVFASLAIIAVGGNVVVLDAHAQPYPFKPIHIVVGFTPGGAADVAARLLAPKLSEQLGQSVVVENRPGAGSSLATERVVAAPADGYTLLLMNAAGAAQAALVSKLPYDIERDLIPVSLVVIGPAVLVTHPSLPVRNVKELIALAKARPGALTYGSAGVGSATHFTGELFNLMSNVKIVHVPFKGGSQSVVATASGEIDINFPSVTSAMPLIEAKKLRALAVTSAKRASMMPDLPTLNESGLRGYDRSSWQGILTPAKVAKDIVSRLNAVLVKIVQTPEMKNALAAQGLEPQTSTPEGFAALIHTELQQNAKLVKLAGIKPE